MASLVLVVVGMKREADLVAGPGMTSVTSGGRVDLLSPRLDAALAETRPLAVVSTGLAGALDPDLRAGDWIVANRVLDGARRLACDDALVRRALALLAGIGVAARAGPILGSDAIVGEAGAKAGLHGRTGALAVDMESHATAAWAAAHGLPFIAIRVVSDRADHDLPPAVHVGIKKDGGLDLAAVLLSLARRPAQLPALLRTGREAEAGFRSLGLLGRHHLLGRLGVGDPDLGQLLLDVV